MEKHIYYFLFIFLLFNACGNKNEQLAAGYLEKAQSLFDNNLSEEAKINLDSLDLLFPKEIETRKKGRILMGEIQQKDLIRNIDFLEKEILKKEAELPELKKNFLFQKDSIYEKYGKFIHKNQRTALTVNRSLLKAVVEETGNFYIESVYWGNNRINHNSFRVSIDDFFIESPVIPEDGAFNRYFEDGGYIFETVSYKNNSVDIFNFIAENTTKKIKITLLGKRNFSFWIEDADKKAIYETYCLGTALEDISKMRNELEKNKKTLEVIEKNIEKNKLNYSL